MALRDRKPGIVEDVNVLALIVSFVLFLGGLLLMGYSFVIPGLEAAVFFAGIIAISLSFGLPIHLLTKVD